MPKCLLNAFLSKTGMNRMAGHVYYHVSVVWLQDGVLWRHCASLHCARTTLGCRSDWSRDYYVILQTGLREKNMFLCPPVDSSTNDWGRILTAQILKAQVHIPILSPWAVALLPSGSFSITFILAFFVWATISNRQEAERNRCQQQ